MDDVLGHLVVAVRDEDLVARDGVGAIAVGYRLGAQGADVGSGLGLGEIHRARPLAGDELGEIPLGEFGVGHFLEGVDGALGEQGAEREAHVGGDHHLLQHDADQIGEPAAAVLRIEGQCAPAGVHELGVRRGPAVGSDDGSVDQVRSLLIADDIERTEHLRDETRRLFDRAVHSVGVESREPVGLEQLAQPDHLVEREANVGERRNVRFHASIVRSLTAR